MSETSVIVHSDPDVLAHSVAARLVVTLIDAQADAPIVAIAFGPGLTVEAALLERSRS